MSRKKLLALVLVVTLLVQPLYTVVLGDSAIPSAAQAAGAQKDNAAALLKALGIQADEAMTWRDGAKLLSHLLGYTEEDAADVDLAAYPELVSDLSLEDDSLYLGILAANGYLGGFEEVITPDANMAKDDMEKLFASAFEEVIDTQKKADSKSVFDKAMNYALVGEAEQLSAIEANRLAIVGQDKMVLTGVQAEVAAISGVGSAYLKGTEIQRVYLPRAADKQAYLHVDSKAKAAEIMLTNDGDAVVEGNGALGVIRVLDGTGTVTVRATASLSNETDADVVAIGPDGEAQTVRPGEIVNFVLEHYVVSFVTEGSPVQTQLLAPGSVLDLDTAFTELEGKIFTAWYRDEEYQEPYSALSTVDGEMTLYARFVDEKDALTVTFETFDGRALAPLVFAKGESLLSKPISSIYSSKDEHTFTGWCIDEECTEAFSYATPIEESMTLYALFASIEQIQEEKGSDNAQLDNLDWQGEIALTAAEGTTLEALPELVTLEPGAGGLDPVLSFRETEDGFAAYGAYYGEGEATGFEPGASFTVVLADGVEFKDYGSEIRSLTVSIFREEVEVVEFAEGLQYVLWDRVTEYNGPGDSDETGTMVVAGDAVFAKDEIVVFYDGEINDDEKTMGAYGGGDFGGYVLFAKVAKVSGGADGTKVTFAYADPVEYIAKLDVHTTRDVDLEGELTDDQMARMEAELTAQIASNEELRAQMLVAVMTSQDTQAKLDERYGVGTYQLAGIKASVGSPTLSVDLSKNGSTVTVSISVSLPVTLKNDDETVLTITPKLSFTEAVTLNLDLNGGFLWVDIALTEKSTTTIALTVTASSDKDGDAGILNTAKEQLEELAAIECLDESIDYMTTISDLMNTMSSIASSDLAYNDIAEIPIYGTKFGYKGIVTAELSAKVVVQVGILATFGIEIKASQGQKVGFSYNFLKLSGGPFSQNLGSSVTTDVYLIGKIGVRIGPKITLGADILSKAKAEISGGIYVYGELTGMLFFFADLIAKTTNFMGGLSFEAGIDAEVDLELAYGKKKKEFSIVDQRIPLYSKGMADKLTIMDPEGLENLWGKIVDDAGKKKSFGFTYVPMKTYNMFNGSSVNNEILWDSLGSGGYKMTVEIENIVVDGETISADDPRNGVLYVGGAEKGGEVNKIYIDEEIAAEYGCQLPECDVIITFENFSTGSIVKKQSHRLHLARPCEFATTTVNLRFILDDWCARMWGIESAPWHGALAYETQIVTQHTLGALYAPTEIAEIDLNEIINTARAASGDMENVTFDWMGRTINGGGGLIQYSSPSISNTCYLTPENSTIRYDVKAETEEYTLTFDLFGYRFPGYTGNVNYIVKLLDQAENTAYGFNIVPSLRATPLAFETAQAEAETTWNLVAHRSKFDGADRPLMISTDEGAPISTGAHINGREPEETVTFELKLDACALNIDVGEGVQGFTIVAPEVDTGGMVAPGTAVRLLVEPMKKHRNVEMASEPSGLEYAVRENYVMFTMPFYDVSATLTAHPANQVDFMFNYGDLGIYKTEYLLEEEVVKAPAQPSVEGLTFRGWYDNPKCEGRPYVFGDVLTDDIVLYADWTVNVTVDFGGATGRAAYHGEDGESTLIFDGDKTEYPRFTYSTLRVGDAPYDIVLPNYDGHNFKGWYLTQDFSGEVVNPAELTLTGGISFYARWAKIIEVRYDLNYGEDSTYHTAYEEGNWPLLDIPAEPVREHYAFTGWYTDAQCMEASRFDPATDLSKEDAVLYAGWVADEFAIEYDLAGGEVARENPAIYTIESGEIALTNPTRTGYTFLGWTGTQLDQQTLRVTIPTGSFGDRVFTAHWEAIIYTITCDPVRGELKKENPATYTIESEDITLNNPSKAKYEFTGWVGTGLDGASTKVVIPKGSIGNREYTATWITDDPDEKIANAAIDAVKKTYTFTLDEYVDGAGKDGSLYIAARGDIVSDKVAGPYAEAIVLKLTKTSTKAVESDVDYTHTYRAETTYTNDKGVSITWPKEVTVVVTKRVATVAEEPVAGDLEYGDTLDMSNFTGGSMKFGEIPIDGTFAWDDETIRPLAADNGVAMYTVVFTPAAAYTKDYAVVRFDVKVKTQVGVRVEITAEDREYKAGDAGAQGSYTLYDADTDEKLHEDQGLKDGRFEFEQIGASDDPLTVALIDYDLDEAVFDPVDDYALTGTAPTTQAMINWIYPVLNAGAPSTVTYDDELSDAHIPNATAKYEDVDIPGSWSLKFADDERTHVNVVGEANLTAIYEPTDQLGYRGGTDTVVVTIQKKAVDEPEDYLFADRVYTGEKQEYGGGESLFYSISENGDVDVNSYPVTFTLYSPEFYRWSQDATHSLVSIERSFKIVQAQVSVGAVSVKNLTYEQLLTTGPEPENHNTTNMLWKRPAKEVITSAPVTFNSKTVNGTWVWDAASLAGLTQPLSANASGYKVKANFNYSLQKDKDNYKPLTHEFTVVIEKAKPNAQDVKLKASPMYQTDTNYFTLSHSKLSIDGKAVTSPITGTNLEGYFDWEDRDQKPDRDNPSKYSTMFYPTVSDNYNTAKGQDTAPVIDKKKMVSGSTKLQVGDPNGDVRKAYITKIIVDGEEIYTNNGTSGEVNVDFNAYCNNHTTIEVLLRIDLGGPHTHNYWIDNKQGASFVGESPTLVHTDVEVQTNNGVEVRTLKYTMRFSEGMWMEGGFNIVLNFWNQQSRSVSVIDSLLSQIHSPGDGESVGK